MPANACCAADVTRILLLSGLQLIRRHILAAGRISEGEVIAQIWILLLGGIGVAAVLDLWAGG